MESMCSVLYVWLPICFSCQVRFYVNCGLWSDQVQWTWNPTAFSSSLPGIYILQLSAKQRHGGFREREWVLRCVFLFLEGQRVPMLSHDHDPSCCRRLWQSRFTTSFFCSVSFHEIKGHCLVFFFFFGMFRPKGRTNI